MFLRYLSSDPNTLQSVQNGQTASTISATSLATNGNSGSSASNFAYSVWFYINNWNYRYGEHKVIFGRMGRAPTSTTGTGTTSTTGTGTTGTGTTGTGTTGTGTPSGSAGSATDQTGIVGLDPCPAVVLGAVENNVNISLGCYPGSDTTPTSTTGVRTVLHTCSVSNVPIQKWVNLTVSVYGRSMDVYIDGKLVRTCLLPGVAAVNNNSDVYVTPLGGFDGWTAKLQYYPNSLNPQEAWNIYSQGYSNWYDSMFNSYQVQIALVENGNTQSSITI
jgi:hypothetical protein